MPGHDETIYSYWPKLGVSLAFMTTLVCLVAIPLGRRQDWYIHQTRLSLCMLFFASCIRQYEENIFDCMQREGAFVPFANQMIDAWLPGFHCTDTQVSESNSVVMRRSVVMGRSVVVVLY
jgi:hypothetical protein